MAKVWRDLIILITAFAAVWIIFTFGINEFFPPESREIDLDLSSYALSEEEELRFGNFITEMYLQDKSIIRNETVDSALAFIYNRLTRGLSEDQSAVQFYVIDSEEINAFTFPGNNIVIHSALIEFSNSPEEFAAVIAHELGHVHHRHVLSKIAAEFGTTILISLITGGDVTVMHQVIGTLVSSAFSRTQESEADAFGMALLEQVQIHPKALGDFFEKLNDQEPSFDSSLQLLMSHPHNDERIQASADYTLATDFSSQPLHLDWEHIKASL